jgi:hypothetical protein
MINVRTEEKRKPNYYFRQGVKTPRGLRRAKVGPLNPGLVACTRNAPQSAASASFFLTPA